MDVGVRELKKRLSEFLDRAARGELIRVTDRGQPKAILGPLPNRFCLDAGISEGWIREGVDEKPLPLKRQRIVRRTTDVLNEDRNDEPIR